MVSIRNKKITVLIQKELASIFRYETVNNGLLISVIRVHISYDMSSAQIYLSIFSPKKETRKILQEIIDKHLYYKHLLGQRLRNKIRKIPELNFRLEDSLDYIENIERELLV
ncbi:MAG: ribosome-binding factor A [Candidatus Walczuchella monophlebidarum]